MSTIDLSYQPKGIYVVYMKSEQEMWAKKVAIE